MEVKKRISVDFNRPDYFLRVKAMQGDGTSRQVEMLLLNDGAAWLPPKGAEPSIVFYHNKTGIKGFYDKLPDDSPAIAVTGNIATVTLVSAMLAEPGDVWVALSFNDAALNRLTAFPFTLSVYPNPAVGATEVEDYIRLQWLDDKFQELFSESVGKINEKLSDMDRCIQAANKATAAANQAAQQLAPDVEKLKKDMAALLSGTKENARFHLGLYRDENGELCELEEE